MTSLSPEIIVAVMFGGILIGIFTGFYVAIAIGAIALIVGLLTMGPPALEIIYSRFLSLLTNYTILACPLFIFMGAILQHAGVAERLYDAFYVWLGKTRGGLAIITILLGAALAVCVGIIAASIIMLSVIALPSMMKRGYSKGLATATVAAGGDLGIFIPPSIMLIVYAEMAGVSAGKLFMGAFTPGFMLAALYCGYILLLGLLKPEMAPAASTEERSVSFIKRTTMLITSILPVGLLILSVLGVIFFGIAPPTEAAAVGGLAAVLLSVAYRRLSWHVMREAVIDTMRLASMVYLIGGLSFAFVGVFLGAGAGKVIESMLINAPGGPWGTLVIVLLGYFILGFFLDWLPIMFIIVPLTSPILPSLGFDPIWFGITICLTLQAAFITPPMAPALFILRGIAPPELGITMADIIKGVVPFIALILVAVALCVAFPQIVLWLPNLMIR